jgi:hypothetical protein
VTTTGPVPLSDAIAELMARYPMTPERAASNARVLDEEVAAWEADHPEETREEDAA